MEIEYFYSAHSAFAYLGSRELERIAEQAGAKVIHRPMDLRRVVAAAKAPTFTAYSDAHMAYFFGIEINRWSEYRGAPVLAHYPRHHDNEIESSNCLLIAALEYGLSIEALAHHLLEAHWRYDADLADPETLSRLADEAGFDGPALMKAAKSETVRATYRNNTLEAIERSVFGAPTYFVDGEMFYGQDRLEFVERALNFSGS